MLLSASSLRAALSAAALLTTFCMALPHAQAFGTYRNAIPNAFEKNCQTCHVRADGDSPWNSFGETIRKSKPRGQTPDWSNYYDIDSDGDGFTNGEELGDPMGTWMSGDPDPPYLSDPADVDDVPEMQAQEDMGMDAMDMGAPPEDMNEPMADMGAPPEDMAPPVDPSDMGGDANGMDMATSGGGADMGADGDDSMMDDDIDEDEPTCAASGLGGAPIGLGFGLLSILGMGFVHRRR